LSAQSLNHTGLFGRNEGYSAEQRLRFEANVSWGPLRFELAEEGSLLTQTPLNPVVALPDPIPRPAWNIRRTIVDNGTVLLMTRVDRLNLKFSQGPVSVIAGKQVVALGVGHLFTAISQTPRQPFVIVDPEYPIPEDAVTVQWEGALALEARFLPRNPGQKTDNFHVRAKGSKGGYDVALTAGRSDDKSFVGVETAGNLGESLLRGEAILYDKGGSVVGQGLAGLDHAFNAHWSAELEVFYAGALAHRSSPYRGDWYTGLRVKWEATERWRVWLAGIVALQDVSVLGHASAFYSLTPSLELGLGQFLGMGSPTSEFGGRVALAPGVELGLPNLTYALIRYYF
jgi:hypothetical protein